MLSGGFDPDRLAPPGRTEPVVSRIVGHDLEFQHEPSPLRPDDSSLSRTFRDLVARFDELSSENVGLREANAGLRADIEQARERLAGLEQSLAALSEASRSALITAAQMLERAEQVIEFRRGGIQAEIDGRFETIKKRAADLEASAVLMLDEARELSSRRVLEVDLETLGILRDGKQSILNAAGNLQIPGHGQGEPPVAPTPEEDAETQPQGTPVQERATG